MVFCERQEDARRIRHTREIGGRQTCLAAGFLAMSAPTLFGGAMSERTIDARRFWAKVEKAKGNDCWEWIAYRNALGYGVFGVGGHRTMLAHRVSFTLTYGEIPADRIVCHKCNVPSCVRPDHLYLGTHASNAADCIRAGRKPIWRGESHPRAKLTACQVAEIRQRYAAGVGILQLANDYPVGKSQIWNIASRREWNEYPEEKT